MEIKQLVATYFRLCESSRAAVKSSAVRWPAEMPSGQAKGVVIEHFKTDAVQAFHGGSRRRGIRRCAQPCRRAHLVIR